MALFVQKANSGITPGFITSLSVTINGQTAGNMNILTIGFGIGNNIPPAAVILSVKDELNNSYLPCASPVSLLNESNVTGWFCGKLYVYYLPNIPAGNHTITVTTSVGAGNFQLSVSEYHVPSSTLYVNSSGSWSNGPWAPLSIVSDHLYATPNDLVIAVIQAYDSPSAAQAPFTQRDQIGMLLIADQEPVSTGFTTVSAHTADVNGFVTLLLRFAVTALPAAPPTGEVFLNDPFIGSGPGGPYLNDGDNWTQFQPGGNAGEPQWARINAGNPCRISRIRVSCTSGAEDLPVGCTISACSEPRFAINPVTLLTISSRMKFGALKNEFIINSVTPYQYYRLNTPQFGSGVTDIDIYTTNPPAGCLTQPSDIAFSPSTGNYDLPTPLTLSTLTTSAKIYYTTDGSAPTTSSNLYSGTFIQSASCTLQAMAVSPGCLSNGRVMSRPVHIGATEVSMERIYDSSNYRLWSMNGRIFFDPISRYWYRYGVNFDTPFIYKYGFAGNSVYRSADMRNWDYRGVIMMLPGAGIQNGGTNNQLQRVCMQMMYNAANHNYVAWSDDYIIDVDGQNAYSQGKSAWTSSSPEGPFTIYQTYYTIGPIVGTSPGIQGDFFCFVDADGVSGWLISTVNGTNSVLIAQLNAAYTGFGTQFAVYDYASMGGGVPGQAEAPSMLYNGGTYFLMFSRTSYWNPNLNFYITSKNVLGPYSGYTVPFSPVPGGVPDWNTSYGGQTWEITTIPGRGYIWQADRYNIENVQGNWGGDFKLSFRLRCPAYFSGGVMSVPWNGAWSFDSIWPNAPGTPLPPTNLIVGGTTATWVNNEPYPYKLYLDTADDAGFSRNVRSIVLPDGTSSATDLPAGGSVRIRAVNAFGTSKSKVVSSVQVGGNPPFMPPSMVNTVPKGGWSTYTGPWEDGPSKFLIPPNIGAPVIYNGQNQGSRIDTANPKPPRNFSPSAADKNLSTIK